MNTLTHKTKTVCKKPDLLQKMEHPRKALTHCKYPKWALEWVEKRLTMPSSEVINGADSKGTVHAQPTTNEVKTKGHIVIPYTKDNAKVSKRSAVDMVYIPTSKVTAPLKIYWSSHG